MKKIDYDQACHIVSNVQSFRNYSAFYSSLGIKIKFLTSEQKIKIRRIFRHARLMVKNKDIEDRSADLAKHIFEFISSIDPAAYEKLKSRCLKKNNKNKRRMYQNKTRKKTDNKILNRKKTNIEDLVRSRRDIAQIGLGLESKVKIRRIRSSDVKIDNNTLNKREIYEKSILYVPGWTLNEDISE